MLSNGVQLAPSGGPLERPVKLREALRLRTSFHRAAATAAFLFFLAELPVGIVFDVTTDIYFWFFAGLLMAVMRLDRVAGVRQPPAPATARHGVRLNLRADSLGRFAQPGVRPRLQPDPGP